MNLNRRHSMVGVPTRISPPERRTTPMDERVQQKVIQVRLRSRSQSTSTAPPGGVREKSAKTLDRLTALTSSAKAKQVRKQTESPSSHSPPTPTPRTRKQHPDKKNTHLRQSLSTSLPNERTKPRQHTASGSNRFSRVTQKGHCSAKHTGADRRATASGASMNTYFDSDSDEDEIFERNPAHGLRALRRQSMPPAVDATLTNHDPLDKELQEIKSRIQRLEMTQPTTPTLVPSKDGSIHVSPPSSVTSPDTPVFDRSSLHVLSHVDYSSISPSANSLRSRGTLHQRQLKDAFGALEQSNDMHPSLMKSLESVMTETLVLNHLLWSLIPPDLQTDAQHLVTMQKSSDVQLKSLTDTLRLLSDSPLTTQELPCRYGPIPWDTYAHSRPLKPRSQDLSDAYIRQATYGQPWPAEPPLDTPQEVMMSTPGTELPHHRAFRVAGVMDARQSLSPRSGKSQYASYYYPDHSVPDYDTPSPPLPTDMPPRDVESVRTKRTGISRRSRILTDGYDPTFSMAPSATAHAVTSPAHVNPSFVSSTAHESYVYNHTRPTSHHYPRAF